MKTADVLLLLDLAARIGIPAVIDIIQAWDSEEVTPEDIAALRDIKQPDDF